MKDLDSRTNPKDGGTATAELTVKIETPGARGDSLGLNFEEINLCSKCDPKWGKAGIFKRRTEAMPANRTGQKKPARRRGVDIKDLDNTKNPKGGSKVLDKASALLGTTVPKDAVLMVDPGPLDPDKIGR